MIFRRWGGGSGIYGQNSDGRGWLQGGEGEVEIGCPELQLV